VPVSIFLFFVLSSIFLSLFYGECNLSSLKVKGPYEVGYTQFRLDKSTQNAVSVFYPMDRGTHSKVIGKSNVKWLPYGKRSSVGFSESTASYGTKKH